MLLFSRCALQSDTSKLSTILDRALAGEAQEIVRRGDPPVLVITKSAVVPRERGTILSALVKHADIELDIPTERKSRRRAPKL